jgi:threonine-phosphate decarboxylase
MMLGGHGGNIYKMARDLGCSPEEIIDMSNNINPLGPPPGLLEYLKANISISTRLPEVDSADTVKQFAGYLGIDSACILAGNGTTQFIYEIPQILGTRRAAVLGPTYSDYADACNLRGIPCSRVAADESADFLPDLGCLEQSISNDDTVFLCNPNNPTGAYIDRAELKRVCQCHPDTRFIIDESYLSFVDSGRTKSMMDVGLKNVIVLLSISKIFAIPGLRIGFIAAPANVIDHFRRYLLPWSVNSLAQTAVQYLTVNESLIRSFIDKTRRFVQIQREEFDGLVKHIPSIKFFPSTTPFFLAKLPASMSAASAWARLAGEKILIRDCSNFDGLSDQFIRISLKSEDANRVLAQKLAVLSESPVNSRQAFERKHTVSV